MKLIAAPTEDGAFSQIGWSYREGAIARIGSDKARLYIMILNRDGIFRCNYVADARRIIYDK